MSFLEKRNALITFSLFSLSSLVFAPFGSIVKLLLLGLCLLSVAVVTVRHALRKRLHCDSPLPLLPPLLALCLSLLSSLLFFNYHVTNLYELADRTITVEASVKEISLRADYMTLATIDVNRVDGKTRRFSATVNIPFETPLEIGDRLTLTAQASLLPEEENGFPVREYYTSQGIFLTLTADAETDFIREEGGDTFTSFFSRLSERLSARLKLLLGEESGGFLSGILTGRRDDVSEAIHRDFRFLGIRHLLAISGLHLTVLVGGALQLCRFLRLRRGISLPLLSALIVFAWCLTGFPPSILRAGLMLFLFLLGDALGTVSDPPTSLAFACALILFVSPSSLYDPGFLLSASATAGLVFISGPFTRKLYQRTAKMRQFWVKPTRWLLAALSVSLSAMLFTLPITVWYFGELALMAPLANLIFIPLTGFLLYLGIALLLCYSLPIIGLLSDITADLTAITLRLVKWAAALAPEPLPLVGNAAPFAFLLTGAVLLYLLLTKKKKVTVLLLTFTVLILSFGTAHTVETAVGARNDTLLTVNIGRNDYLLLNSGGRTLLVDISDGSYSAIHRAASLSRQELADPSIDAVLYTHLHRKHTASFSRLTDNHRISVLCLPKPYDTISTEVATALSALAEKKGMTVVFYDTKTESTVAFDSCHLLLAPLGYLDRSVQPLVSLTILGKGRFVYLGGGVTESDTADRMLLEAITADAVLLGIHGPLIKQPLAALPLAGTVLAANAEVNEAYGTAFDIVGDGKTIAKKLVFR